MNQAQRRAKTATGASDQIRPDFTNLDYRYTFTRPLENLVRESMQQVASDSKNSLSSVGAAEWSTWERIYSTECACVAARACNTGCDELIKRLAFCCTRVIPSVEQSLFLASDLHDVRIDGESVLEGILAIFVRDRVGLLGFLLLLVVLLVHLLPRVCRSS